MKKILFLFFLISQFVLSQTENDSINKGRFFLDFSGGFSKRLGSIEETGNYVLDQKIESAARGYFYEIGLNAQLIPNSSHYMGLKFNQYLKILNGNKISTSFVGIGYMYSPELNDGSFFAVDAYLGYIIYKDNEFYIDDYVMKSGSLGFTTSAAYYIYIAKGIYFGPKLGLQFGSSKKFKVSSPMGNETLNFEEAESFSKIDFGLSFRFNL